MRYEVTFMVLSVVINIPFHSLEDSVAPEEFWGVHFTHFLVLVLPCPLLFNHVL